MKHILIMLFTVILWPNAVSSQETQTLSYDTFSKIPVLHQGRFIPMDSFARIQLQHYHDKETISGKSPVEWLAEVLFDPQAASERPLFRIRNKALKKKMDLDPEKNYFALQDLYQKLNETIPELRETLQIENPTYDQQAFLELHDDVNGFLEIMRSFSLIMPLEIALPESIAARHGNKEKTFLELSRHLPQADNTVHRLTQSKGQDLSLYTEEEQKLLTFAMTMQSFASLGQNNNIFRVIPSSWTQQTHEWFSPWALLNSGKAGPETRAFSEKWYALTASYRNNDAQEWDRLTEDIYTKITTDYPQFKWKMSLEIAYNTIEPFALAVWFYTAGVIILLLASKFPGKILIKSFGLLLYAMGTLMHTSGIVTRMVLMQRPPVATLYESVLFVSLVTALYALVMALHHKKTIYLIPSAIASIIMLALAPGLITQGTSLEVLSAVLNTNFWLATHVVVITLGYGLSIVAGSLAHAYFIADWIDKGRDLKAQFFKSAFVASIAALLFTAIGTALGGVWADQSWGRFWGWDPKENGALLIVLWLVWLHHGRHSGHLKKPEFMAGLAFVNIVVALAWFGVNLLGVGLHSYGFISGIGTALAVFCASETIIITALYVLDRYKTTNTANP